MEIYNLEDDRDLEYCRATVGKRFANYIIDLVFFYIIIIGVGIVIEILSPGLISEINSLLDRLITIICYGLLMFLIEAACHGKSLGKLITGTKAINIDGTEMSFQKAFLRNITRSIPFNALSALGTPCIPWHDKWTDTMVVDEKMLSIRKQDFQFTPLES